MMSRADNSFATNKNIPFHPCDLRRIPLEIFAPKIYGKQCKY